MQYYLFTTELRRGGVQRVVSIIAEQWSRDASVTIILLRNEVEFNIPETVKIITLDLATSPLHFFTGKLALQARHKLRSILKKTKGPFAFYSFLEMPNFVSVLIKNSFSNGVFIGGIHVNVFMYSRIFHFLYPCYKNLDALIACSQGNRHLFIEKFGLPAEKVFFIPNPIDFDAIERQSAEEVPSLLKKLAGKKIILAVGRLVKEKNYPLLIRAFARMLAIEKNAFLIILGEGPERHSLMNIAESLGINARMQMPGKVNNPYVWMANSDLFVLSSNFEGWPMVMVEAMVAGLPVVACDCQTGPAEILRNGAFGQLVPTNNVEALSAAMEKQLHQEKTEYPFLREWDVNLISRRYRAVATDILRSRNQ